MPICNNCGYEGTGNYCAECGKHFEIKRLTVTSLLHEVAHLFTHLDKGFAYTLKQLGIRPGRMQKDYIRGKRSVHQKPFSMFFVCATIAGLAIYWISKSYITAQDSPFEEMRMHFYQLYFVIFQSVLTPFYALVLWLLFRSKNLNYTEALVLFVYSFAFMLLFIGLVNLINLIPNHFGTYYVELPVLAVYVIWTNLNFFSEQPAWLVISKSIVNLVICWSASNLITDQVIRWMM